MNTNAHSNEVTYKIRAARLSEQDTIVDLLNAVGLPTDGFDQQFEAAFVVAEDDGDIVAAAALEQFDNYGLLRSVAVRPSLQAQGIGRALIAERLDASRELGLVSVFLLTTTPDYFAPLGFHQVDRNSVPSAVWRSQEFCGECCDSAIAMMWSADSPREKRRRVQESYAQAARRIEQKATSAEGGCGCGCATDDKPSFAEASYNGDQLSAVSGKVAQASLGSGNPVSRAQLHDGEHVLDLGSGGGIDVLLAAQQVGETGHAYGLDMTPQMLEMARRNQSQAGVTNASFLEGEIESIPLADQHVDVVLSNCVINLSTEKTKALAEAYRVLKPGGRFVVSDIVATEAVSDKQRENIELWSGCISGAIEKNHYEDMLRTVGFVDAKVDIIGDVTLSVDCECGCDAPGADFDPALFARAIVTAHKPV